MIYHGECWKDSDEKKLRYFGHRNDVRASVLAEEGASSPIRSFTTE